MNVRCPQAVETVGIGLKAHMGSKDICDHSRAFMSDSFPETRRGLSSLCECTGFISVFSAVGAQDEVDVTTFASKSMGLFGGEGSRETHMREGERRGEEGQRAGVRLQEEDTGSMKQRQMVRTAGAFLLCLQTHCSSCVDVSCYSCVCLSCFSLWSYEE